jgi:hypothetical protein
MKKTYKITFNAELSEEDVRAMKKYFYDTMNESMEISDVWGLELEAIDGDSEDGKEVSFDTILPIVNDWFVFIGEEDCENIAQMFAIGMSEGKDVYEIFEDVCSDYRLDAEEFEGICSELEDLRNE